MATLFVSGQTPEQIVESFQEKHDLFLTKVARADLIHLVRGLMVDSVMDLDKLDAVLQFTMIHGQLLTRIKARGDQAGQMLLYHALRDPAFAEVLRTVVENLPPRPSPTSTQN